MLSIVVLNMAKYTIISLILTDFVPISVIFNLFRNVLGGQSVSHNSQIQRVPKFRLGEHTDPEQQIGFMECPGKSEGSP